MEKIFKINKRAALLIGIIEYVFQSEVLWFRQNCCNSNMSGWKAKIRLRHYWNWLKQWRVNFGDVETFFEQPILSWSWPKHIRTDRKNLKWNPRNIYKYPIFFTFLKKIIISIWIASIPHKYDTGKKLQSWFFFFFVSRNFEDFLSTLTIV